MAHCRLQNREGIHEDIRVFTNSHQVDKKNPRQAGHRAWSLTLWKQDTVDFDFTVGRDIVESYSTVGRTSWSQNGTLKIEQRGYYRSRD